jgi:hypothetical protein
MRCRHWIGSVALAGAVLALSAGCGSSSPPPLTPTTSVTLTNNMSSNVTVTTCLDKHAGCDGQAARTLRPKHSFYYPPPKSIDAAAKVIVVRGLGNGPRCYPLTPDPAPFHVVVKVTRLRHAHCEKTVLAPTR